MPTNLVEKYIDDGYITWQAGTGSFDSEKSKTSGVGILDVARVSFKPLTTGDDYVVKFNMAGSGHVSAYIWPLTDDNVDSQSLDITLGDWQTYTIKFHNQRTKTNPQFFIRTNADDQAIKFYLNDVRCYKVDK